MKKKILHIITSKAFGGLELYVTQLVKELQKSGLSNYVYCQYNSRIENELLATEIQIKHCKSDFYFDVFDLFKIIQLIKKEKIDIIHSHTRMDVWKASLAKMFVNKLPHIHSVYMLPTNKRDIIHRFIYSKVDAIVSSSQFSNLLIEKNYPISSSKIHLIRYGRDVKKYKMELNKRQEIRNMWQCSDDDIVVISMSRVDEQKGLRDFALSFNYLPSHLKEKIKFWIVGEPTIDKIDRDGNPIYEAESKNLYNWLKDYVQKPDIQGRIMLIPFQKDFISYLGSADIFILPSRNEMYSLAVIDAMLLSLPVIGTRAEGTQEQISDSYNGILVDISSPKQIAEAITKLVANPDIIRFISNNAMLKAKKEHNWEKTIEDWIKLYSSFLRL